MVASRAREQRRPATLLTFFLYKATSRVSSVVYFAPATSCLPPPRRRRVRLYVRQSNGFFAVSYILRSVQVRPYLLLRSILWQLAAIAEGLRPDGDDDASSSATTSTSGGNIASATVAAGSSKQSPDEGTTNEALGPRDLLVTGLCTLRLLRTNLYHLTATRTSPGTVGLGTTSSGGGHGSSGRRGDSRAGGFGGSGGKDQRSPFASGLLSLLLDYAGGVLDVFPASAGTAEGCEGRAAAAEESREMAALRRAVRYEAAEIVGRGLYIFLPEPAQKVSFLSALLKLAGGSDGGGGGTGPEHYNNDYGEDEEDSKDEENLEENKAWDGKRGSVATSTEAAAAMADGLLPADMDEEGCAALLSGVCNAVCSDPYTLLTFVPDSIRPSLTVRDVPSYVASKVRSAEKAQAQALQQRMLKEAAAAVGATSGSSSPGGGGGSLTGGSRGRVLPGSDDGDGLGLWKTGSEAGLPRPGDIVGRGPDWAWGGQDGDAGGRGLVVALATWGREVRSVGVGKRGASRGAPARAHRYPGDGGRNAVRVMWQKGAINIYRWGASDSSEPDGKPCYDLRVLRPPSAVHDESAAEEDTGTGCSRSGTGGSSSGSSNSIGSMGGGGGNGSATSKGTTSGGKSQGQVLVAGKGRAAARGELKWTMEEVEAALLPERVIGKAGDRGGVGTSGTAGGQETPTVREVLRFIKNNAPQEWREPRRITGAENAMVKVKSSVGCKFF